MSRIAVNPSVVAMPTRARTAPVSARWGFPEIFIISQTVLPGLLYLPGTQPIRIPIRIAAYGMSLIAMVIWAASKRSETAKNPSRNWLIAAVAYLVLMIAHPTTNSFMAGMAQTMLYLAVLAPVFWAPGMVQSPAHLRRLLAILLVCNGINSVVGILQVYDPDRWMPKEFTSVTADIGAILTYVGPDGKKIIRPTGLTDAPGGVCGPAVTAGLLGLAFAISTGLAAWKRAAALAFSFTGVAAIYLTQVRSSLVVLSLSVIVYIILLFLQKERKRATALLAITTSVIVSALAFAIFLGGESVRDRFSTLIEGDPRDTYQAARGGMVQSAFEILLVKYPMGAGLGRWGMIRGYFGEESNLESPMIWAEVQWASWILDGGIVLLSLYSIALIVAMWNEWVIARRHPNPAVRSMTALVLATNLGTLALLFSYVPFCGAVGVQYWFLAGAVSGIARMGKPKRAGEPHT